MSTLITIQIVGWNSAEQLAPGLKALQFIPADEVAIRYLDNGSTDDSVKLVRQMLLRADIVELKKNAGFSGAHNHGIALCDTPFVLVHDPDVAIDWPAIRQLLPAFADPSVGAVQGKLLRTKTTLDEKTVIDSAGIVFTKALNGRERGANEIDREQFNSSADLLAVTGACSLYRVAALRQIAHGWRDGVLEIFDADFFAYKEDVDVGWRLKRAGYKSIYIPITMGHHQRTLGKRGFMNWGLNLRTIYQRLRSPRTRYSLRNWIWMLIKNITLRQDMMHELAIDARLLTFFCLSLLYPPLLTVWVEVFRGIPKMVAKRI